MLLEKKDKLALAQFTLQLKVQVSYQKILRTEAKSKHY